MKAEIKDSPGPAARRAAHGWGDVGPGDTCSRSLKGRRGGTGGSRRRGRWFVSHRGVCFHPRSTLSLSLLYLFCPLSFPMPPPHSVPTLAIVVPRPSLQRRRSSLLSQAPSPRTPSCGSPVHIPVFLPSNGNRKSSDSWNSSNHDADDTEYEWKPDQTRLLLRVCLFI